MMTDEKRTTMQITTLMFSFQSVIITYTVEIRSKFKYSVDM